MPGRGPTGPKRTNPLKFLAASFCSKCPNALASRGPCLTPGGRRTPEAGASGGCRLRRSCDQQDAGPEVQQKGSPQSHEPAGSTAAQQSAEKSGEEWIQLFNGKDLNDWQVKFKGEVLGENYKNTFRVEDGLLRVSYDNWEQWNGEFGHLFYKDEFSHYRLRVEYRFIGSQAKNGPGWAFRNNGLMIHGQSAESMELDQDFPTSIEVQLLGGVTRHGERPTMILCSPGPNVVMNAE